MNDTTTEQITQELAAALTKSKMEEHFAPSFVELIRLSPNNPIVRAQMMRILLKEPPKEIDGYEALKKWVEENFESKAKIASIKYSTSNSIVFETEWSIGDIESGRCDYSVSRTGSYTSSIAMDAIETWIDDGKSVQDITDMIYDEVSENYDSLCMEYNNYDYDNEESDRTEQFEAEPDGGYRQLRERLIETVRTNLGDEYATALENNSN